ncbi:hypothetical protein [Acinetobacter sp. ANC 5045]|uniref:hypothetical protein n=1 Tax=Acinetobacter sp. ANC 5045 TaxID=2529851 RepID=UPI00103A9F5A|nr:hypothetical protein [Acinetobacter sp. ANC 5045]TCB18991.1 hypothetical protein E0H79_05800 [Acinetobacter sp. ANC 5045]
MEKYLRLLNPKTTNFDSIGGGSHGAITAQDVCVALSYAKLTPLQDNLIRLKCFGANTASNLELFSKYLVNRYCDLFACRNISAEHFEAVTLIALAEFCLTPADYKPTVRNRAVLGGVHYLMVHRYLNDSINDVLNDLQEEFSTASDKLIFQLRKTN